MPAISSRQTKTMAASSDAQSRMSVETYLCECEKKAKLFTSRTARNPGRRFLGCGQPQGTRCNFFHWFDVEALGRHGEVVTQLNDRRFLLEEKLVVIERKLADVEEKLAGKKQQTRVLKRKNLMLGRLCFVLMMVVTAMVVLMFEKKMT